VLDDDDTNSVMSISQFYTFVNKNCFGNGLLIC